MAQASLDIQAGFLAYGDGSGYQVAATVRDCDDGQGPMLSINTVHEFDASKWPEVRDGIERLLRAVPHTNGDRASG